MITAHTIKTALIFYCRFRRQWICAPEVDFNWGWADVLVDTGTQIYEIEVKVSKSDLWNGEAKKSKHWRGHQANKFYLCVPQALRDEAIKWVESINPKYGIMLFQEPSYIVVGRTAKTLKMEYDTECGRKIIKRLSSIVYDYMKRNKLDGDPKDLEITPIPKEEDEG